MSNQRFTGTDQYVASDDLIARPLARSWVNGCLR
jgi:hypothetical protein